MSSGFTTPTHSGKNRHSTARIQNLPKLFKGDTVRKTRNENIIQEINKHIKKSSIKISRKSTKLSADSPYPSNSERIWQLANIIYNPTDHNRPCRTWAAYKYWTTCTSSEYRRKQSALHTRKKSKIQVPMCNTLAFTDVWRLDQRDTRCLLRY